MATLRDLILPAPLERCGSRDYPVLSMTMHDGIMLQSERFKKSLASVDQSSYKVVHRNQLVVGFPIDEGVLYIQKAADVGIMSPAYDVWNVNQDIIDLDYLELSLHSPQSMQYYKTNLRGTTARRRSLPKDVLLSLPVKLPDITVQKQIAEIIKTVKDIILRRQQELSALDNLIKARFVEMFGDCKLNPKGWNTVALGDISEVGSSKRVFVEELKENGIPFYRGTEVGALAEGITITPELFITADHYAELVAATGKPAIGDLLMPSICPDGRIWVVDTEDPFYFKDGRVLWVHSIDKDYDPVFLLYTLKDRIMTDYNSIASGTTFAELKIFALKKCRVFDVPLHLQQQFVTFIKQIDKSKFAVKKALDEAQLLFDSLMQKYFG